MLSVFICKNNNNISQMTGKIPGDYNRWHVVSIASGASCSDSSKVLLQKTTPTGTWKSTFHKVGNCELRSRHLTAVCFRANH